MNLLNDIILNHFWIIIVIFLLACLFYLWSAYQISINKYKETIYPLTLHNKYVQDLFDSRIEDIKRNLKDLQDYQSDIMKQLKDKK
jgi:YbbR domain-containing protein